MITFLFTIWCDRCSHWEYSDKNTRARVKREAARKGWYVDIQSGEHLCPECVKKLAHGIT